MQSGWQYCCGIRVAFISRSYYNPCETRGRALLLRSSSRLQLWPSQQLSLQQYRPWMQETQLYGEPEVVCSSEKKQNSGSSKFGSVKTVFGEGYCLRTLMFELSTLSSRGSEDHEKAPGHSGIKKASKKSRRATEKPPRATFSKKRERLSAFRHWSGPRQPRHGTFPWHFRLPRSPTRRGLLQKHV